MKKMLTRKERWAEKMAAEPTRGEQATKTALEVLGIPFYHQCVISNYILDFYLADFKIDLEVDGRYHKNRKQYSRDKKRADDLKYGYEIDTLRFDNADARDSRFVRVLSDALYKADPALFAQLITEQEDGTLEKWLFEAAKVKSAKR